MVYKKLNELFLLDIIIYIFKENKEFMFIYDLIEVIVK